MSVIKQAMANALTAEQRAAQLAIKESERLRQEAAERLRREAAERLRREEAAKNLRPGYLAGDKGIFIGTWEPKDCDGSTIGKTFNVFAAPEDLNPPDTSGANCRQFVEAAKELGNRRDGLKLDPENYEKGLIAALKDGSAIGKWFIPTCDLLHGKDIDGNVVRDTHLFGLQNEGDFKGTFTTEKNSSSNYPHYYWSCTEPRGNSTDVGCVRFSDGRADWDRKDFYRMSCRPVRVEPAP